VEPRIELRPRPVDDPEVRRPDITRAVTELGWKPRVSLEEGVQRTVPWFRRALEDAGRSGGRTPRPPVQA
jgi:nucleoside-diphosphate-sugar epimerase